MKRTKTWAERLHAGKPHQVKPVPTDMAGMKAGQLMLVPTAAQVDGFIKAIPPGHSLDAKQLRQALAAAHHAEVTCPVTIGFHLRTVAEAAWEAIEAGTPLHHVTPFWRALPPGSLTLKKLSFDTRFIQRQRQAEGLDAEPPPLTTP